MIKKSLVAALTAVVLIANASVAYAGAYSPYMPRPDQGYFGFNFVETFASTGEASSFIYNVIEPADKKTNPEGFEQFLCMDGYGKAPCNFGAESSSHLHGQVVAPPCTEAKQINCIESVSIYKTGEVPIPASLEREIAGDLIEANPSQNLPAGGTKSVWLSNTKHSGGTGQYVAYVALGLAFNAKTKKFLVSQFSAQVQPTTQKTGDYRPTTYQEFQNENGLTRVSGSAGPSECVWLDSGLCGVLEDFADDTRVSVTIRLSSTVGGWFKGRMYAPDISIQKLSSGANRIRIDAAPVNVPMVTAWASNTSSDPDVLKVLEARPEFKERARLYNTRSDYPSSIETLDLFRAIAEDKASGVNSIWSVGTAPNGFGGGRCLSDSSKVLGIVTTNATVYEGSAPNFSGGYLRYIVAGMHYLPDDSVALGTYDLVMRSETARCLYGLSQTPLSASVTVTNEKGGKSTATTIVSEKNGWLKMAAYGFTFSKKTIKVKITKKVVKKK